MHENIEGDDQGIEALRRDLDSDPTNLDAANRYWNALSSFKGHDVRSGRYVIAAYRRAALASQEGVIALARACRELFENSGEVPRAAFFDKAFSKHWWPVCQNCPSATAIPFNGFFNQFDEMNARILMERLEFQILRGPETASCYPFLRSELRWRR